MTDTALVIEAMLLRWSDSHNGRTVTLLLSDDGGDHPFRGLKCGPANGERLAISVARISDDETRTPVEVKEHSRPPDDEIPVSTVPAGGDAKRTFTSLPKATQAGILCNEPAFWKFLQEKYLGGGAYRHDNAAQALRAILGLSTRADLAKNAEASKLFDEIVNRYRLWQREAEIVPEREAVG